MARTFTHSLDSLYLSHQVPAHLTQTWLGDAANNLRGYGLLLEVRHQSNDDFCNTLTHNYYSYTRWLHLFNYLVGSTFNDDLCASKNCGDNCDFSPFGQKMCTRDKKCILTPEPQKFYERNCAGNFTLG